MPRKKTPVGEYTDEEVIKKLFPKKAVDEAKKEAENPMSPAETRSKKSTKKDSK
jgi:hypothetical protein